MAEALGPIHYLMYDKIKYQDQLTRQLLEDQADLLADLDRRQPPVSEEPLETLIDQDNIHGWLSSKVDIVENRLAFAEAHANDSFDTMKQAGKAAAAGKTFADGEELFAELNKYLLDGMPCDRALSAVSLAKAEGLHLVQNVEVHKRYAEELLAIDPAASLTKDCAGGHGHDDHDAFYVVEDTTALNNTQPSGSAEASQSTEKSDSEEASAADASAAGTSRSLFYQCREAWLVGFLDGSGYRVEPTGEYDFLLVK